MDARTVAPEWLDSLPADSPEAMRSRRDLRIIHRFMRTRSWLAQQLAALPPQARGSIAELGAGDGQLMRAVREDLNDLRVCGYDLIAQPADWPSDWDWLAGDFTRLNGFAEQTIIALMILHHFENDKLLELGKKIQAGATRYLLVVEPARYPKHILLLQAGRLLGFCKTTLHDGAVSIRAGFLDEELPHRLGLDPAQWGWHCQSTTTGAYRMFAWRKSPGQPDGTGASGKR
jgi:hypothetical protein